MANYTQDFKRGVAGFPARSASDIMSFIHLLN